MTLGDIVRGYRWYIVVLVAVLAVVGVMCSGVNELSYSLFGQTTEADLTDLVERTSKRPGSGAVVNRNLIVSYQFTEPDGTRRTGSAQTDAAWTVPPSGKVAVEYTPGAQGSTRLAGTGSGTPVVLLGLLLLLAVGAIGVVLLAFPADSGRRPVV